jgi:hypothetical protein
MDGQKNEERGRQIRTFRQYLKLTQKEFGIRIGDQRGPFSKSCIANYEAGFRPGRRAEKRILEEARKENYPLTLDDFDNYN